MSSKKSILQISARAGRFLFKWLIVAGLLLGCLYVYKDEIFNSHKGKESDESVALEEQDSSNQEEQNSSESKEQTPEDLPVRSVIVRELVPKPIDNSIRLPGLVEAIDDIDLASSIAGTVEWVGVSEGDRVRAGQAIFRIDQRSRQAQLDDAKAAYELAKRNLTRQENLKNSGLVSPEAIDQTQTALRRAEAALKLAETQLSLGIVQSPVDGFVDRIDLDEGEYTHDGTVLAHIVNIETVKVVIGVAERDVDAVARQKTAWISIDALQKQFEAEITHVAYAANLKTNTFETTLHIANPELEIRPGMIAHAHIVKEKFPDALTVPLFSLVNTANGPIVYVENGGHAVSVPVQLGPICNSEIVIMEGLKPGQRVIVRGQRDVADGQPVRVAEDDGTRPVTPAGA